MTVFNQMQAQQLNYLAQYQNAFGPTYTSGTTITSGYVPTTYTYVPPVETPATPTPKKSALAWLDERIDEMRVRL